MVISVIFIMRRPIKPQPLAQKPSPRLMLPITFIRTILLRLMQLKPLLLVRLARCGGGGDFFGEICVL